MVTVLDQEVLLVVSPALVAKRPSGIISDLKQNIPQPKPSILI